MRGHLYGGFLHIELLSYFFCGIAFYMHHSQNPLMFIGNAFEHLIYGFVP